MNTLSGKVVIITGASSGIGRSTALAAARKGAKLALGARNLESLKEVAEECRSFKTEAIAMKVDVSDELSCRNLILEAVNRFGRIDVLINNAGISMRALFLETDLSVIRKLMDTNFWGTVYCTKYALPYLLQSKGSLAGISSIAGNKGLPARTGYSASKFAVQGFLEVVRIEHLHDGLHVLVACPGFTTSNIRNTALAADGSAQGESPRDEDKMMSSAEAAKHILTAIEKRKRSIVLTSQGKLTVWLNKFFPAWVDKLVYSHMAKEPDSPFGKQK